jgi:hypothetical protein
MSQFVRVKQGYYAGKDVINVVLPLTQGMRHGARGNYITVNGALYGHDRNVRILVNNASAFEPATRDDYTGPAFSNNGPLLATEPSAEPSITMIDEVAAAPESDEEVMERIRTRFSILHQMTTAATNGDIRAMIVSGPPGVGKSFGVEQELDKHVLFDQVATRPLRAEVIKGSATALGLYQKLYHFREDNCVLVFDDCDVILFDDVSLNLLKGALDSGKKRKISWLSESRVLKDEGIPNTFEFNGAVIFITNLDFDAVKSVKLKEHLAALQSRCHYLDLTMHTMRDRILRIKQIATDGELFADYGFTDEQQAEIIEFMVNNQNTLREVSLRMALKIADLVKSFPDNWTNMAQATCTIA